MATVSSLPLERVGKHVADWTVAAAAYGSGYHTWELTPYNYSQMMKVNICPSPCERHPVRFRERRSRGPSAYTAALISGFTSRPSFIPRLLSLQKQACCCSLLESFPCEWQYAGRFTFTSSFSSWLTSPCKSARYWFACRLPRIGTPISKVNVSTWADYTSLTRAWRW